MINRIVDVVWCQVNFCPIASACKVAVDAFCCVILVWSLVSAPLRCIFILRNFQDCFREALNAIQEVQHWSRTRQRLFEHKFLNDARAANRRYISISFTGTNVFCVTLVQNHVSKQGCFTVAFKKAKDCLRKAKNAIEAF